jgi:formate dehydrogenase iron-sulfur subunit
MKPVTAVATGVTVAGLAAMFALGAGYKRDKLVYNEKTGDTINVKTGEVVKHGDGQDEMSVKEHILGKNE